MEDGLGILVAEASRAHHGAEFLDISVSVQIGWRLLASVSTIQVGSDSDVGD